VLADLDGRRQGRTQEFDGFLDHRLKQYGFQFQFALSTERKNLLDKVLGPLGSREYGAQIVIAPRGLVQLHHGHFRVAENGCEDVVEIVGNPASKGADCFHLLRVTQLIFKIFIFRNIPQVRQ